MAMVAENGGDQFTGGASASAVAAETEYQRDVRNLAELFSGLNPLAKEFIPSSARKPDPRLSADAPSFEYYHIKDSSSDGSSNQPRRSYRRRRNGYNHVRKGMNPRHQKEQKIRRTVYVSDIGETVTEEDLAGLFNQCGHVEDCRICGDPHSYLRFAFIEFSKESEARAALNLGGTMLGFYPLRVLPSKTAIVPVNDRFLPKSPDEREMVVRTVYCTNIDKKVTQAELKYFFEQYCGEVKRLRLLMDNKHATCIAFVEFSEAQIANTALNYSGALLGTLPIRVSPSKTPVRPNFPRTMMN